MSPQDFINESMGKRFDIDGYYGAQCWDLFARYCQRLGYPIFHCTVTGYVGDIWTQRNVSGILDYFNEVDISTAKQGDVVVFKKDKVWTPDTHIGVFDEWTTSTRFMLVSQNQYGKSHTTKGVFPVSAVMGVLRPKAFDNITPVLKKSGTAIALFDYIRVRTKPVIDDSTATGNYYHTGGVLNYSSIVEGDGWLWLEYMSYSGELHYCALQTLDGKTIYWKQK